MQNLPCIHRSHVKGLSIGLLGLALIIGWAEVSLALPKLKPGKTYCSCSCKTFSKGVGLDWEKVASCSLNGKSCKGKNSAGVLEDGVLQHCNECRADSSGQGYSSCTPVKDLSRPNLGGTTPPVLPGTLDPGSRQPSVAPFSHQGTNAPVFRRGIEGETPAPSSTESGNSGK